MADLTTLANVKGYIPNLGTVTTYDAVLTRLIATASGWIRAYLNRDVLTASYTDLLDGTGTTRLMVDNYPIKTISSITVEGTLIASSRYVFRRREVLLMDGTRWNRGVGNVVIAYTAGYDTIPAELEQACIELVAWRFRERERIGVASKSLQTGGEVESYQITAAPASVLKILDNWRRVV